LRWTLGIYSALIELPDENMADCTVIELELRLVKLINIKQVQKFSIYIFLNEKNIKNQNGFDLI
jgi:hypothetical protein